MNKPLGKNLKHEETVEWNGKTFKATLLRVDELYPKDFITLDKMAKSALQNRKDIIKKYKNDIESIKEQIKFEEEALKTDEKRYSDMMEKNVLVARRNLSILEKKQLEKEEAQEKDLLQKREDLIKAYETAKVTEKQIEAAA